MRRSAWIRPWRNRNSGKSAPTRGSLLDRRWIARLGGGPDQRIHVSFRVVESHHGLFRLVGGLDLLHAGNLLQRLAHGDRAGAARHAGHVEHHGLRRGESRLRRGERGGEGKCSAYFQFAPPSRTGEEKAETRSPPAPARRRS